MLQKAARAGARYRAIKNDAARKSDLVSGDVVSRSYSPFMRLDRFALAFTFLNQTSLRTL